MTIVFASYLLLSFAPAALAADDLKVYYTEPLGGDAGEKVYHIESCKKTPAYGILRCSEETKDIAPKQCIADADGKIPNIPIKGCLKDSEDDSEYLDVGKNYKKVYPELMQVEGEGTEESPGCSNKPEKQGNYYAPVWGAILVTSDNIEIQKGTFVAPEDKKASMMDALFPGMSSLIAKQKYNATLCAKWDVLDNPKPDQEAVEALTLSDEETPDLFSGDDGANSQSSGSGTGTPQAGGPLTQFVRAQSTKFTKEFAAANCNTDNSTQDITNFPKSTPFDENDTYTCSIKERITGQTGAEIFGKYVSGLYKWAASIVGIVAVLTMVWAGVQMSVAGGDQGKVDNAKNLIMKSLIGLAILFLSGLILYTINPGFFVG